MIVTEMKKRLAPQKCPLCNNMQDIIFNGHHPIGDNPMEVKIDKDKGYSFCNCRNIYFTDWNNIRQGTYDEKYFEKYQNETTNALYNSFIKRYMPYIFENLPDKTSPLKDKAIDVGAINPTILDNFKRAGFGTYGIDIMEHPMGDHELIVANFEDYDIRDEDKGSFTVIWASHVFEHFKNPVKAVDVACELLREGGLLFVAMPDPYFIDFNHPYKWGHWHLWEHHILWDMDSFAELLEERGFEVIIKKHNPDYRFVCTADFHVLAKKK